MPARGATSKSVSVVPVAARPGLRRYSVAMPRTPAPPPLTLAYTRPPASIESVCPLSDSGAV